MTPSPAAFEGWLNSINRICDAFTGHATGDAFQGDIIETRQGALKMSVVQAAHARLVRQRGEVARSAAHHYFAVFQLEGATHMRQGDAQETLRAGDIMFIDNRYPSDFTFEGRARQLSLILPHERVEALLTHGTLRAGQKVAAQVAVAGLATQLLLGTQGRDDLSHGESEAVLDSLVSLLRPALLKDDPPRDAQEKAYRRCVDWIERHLCEAELSPEQVARHCGISLRGLYRAFGRHGQSVAQYIRDRRLDRCAQGLRDGSARGKMAGVADQFGFINSSYFTTAFKARFGVAPSEYRKRCH
ncbi:transcriptional regulator FeaR [Pseudomonas sp. RIT-To-2]|uniref:transcriptional regulator FeaR n=1 Tax=Pseudomonas sp. RIT-To-2 TaxID=3462541 RepID=UPI0024130E43